MSESELIKKMRRSPNYYGARVSPDVERETCPIWGEEKFVNKNRDAEGNPDTYFGIYAGGAFRNPNGNSANGLSQIEKANISAEIFSQNSNGIIPELGNLLSKVNLDNVHDCRRNMHRLITAIAADQEGGAVSMLVAEENPGFGRGHDEEPWDMDSFAQAASGCLNGYELENLLSETIDRGLVKTEVPEPPGNYQYARLTIDGVELAKRLHNRAVKSLPLSEIVSVEKNFVCVDTNILIQFQQLESWSWRELFQRTNEVNVIIPMSVCEEIDRHKGCDNDRLRKRAREFYRRVRKIEVSPDGVLEIREEDPRVTIRLATYYRTSELDGDQYDLQDPDGRILAEVSECRTEYRNLIFLSDDTKPIAIARQTGINVLRPYEQWRAVQT